MKGSYTLLKFGALLLVALVLVGLLWWYTFLRGQQQNLAQTDAGRGAGAPAPSFGSPVGSTYNNVISTIASSQTESPSAPHEQLTKINQAPTAGFAFVAGTSTTLRFVERSSGYVFDATLASGTLNRLTDTLVPRVYEALIARNGRVVERTYEDGTITTIAGDVVLSSTSTNPGKLKGSRLPDNIPSIALDPTGREFFYVAPQGSGFAGVRAPWDGTKLRVEFTTNISGWQIRWLSDGRLVLVQNAADGVTGYAYELRNGVLVPLVQGLGLTALPRASSTAILYGQSSGNSLSLSARLSASTTAIALPVRTVADKCVWSPGKTLVAYCAAPIRNPGSDFLDRWYRGEVHSADAWWQIDVSAGSATLIYTPSANTTIDVEDPVIDDSGMYIAFTNAVDKSLWLLKTTK